MWSLLEIVILIQSVPPTANAKTTATAVRAPLEHVPG